MNVIASERRLNERRSGAWYCGAVRSVRRSERSNLRALRSPRPACAGLAMTGFTLIEIIVSMVILAILAAGIFSMISYSKRMSLRMQEKAVAVSLIENKMNELKRIGAEGLSATVSQSGEEENPVHVDCTPANETYYQCVASELGGRMKSIELSVEVIQPSEGGGKEVKVEAEWQSLLGNTPITRKESVVTYLVER